MSRMSEIYQEIHEFLEKNELLIKSCKYDWLDVSMLSEAKR